MKTNPLTSSQTSRTAATPGSSSGSMPPPGTIHRSGWRLLLTSSTCGEQSTADGAPPALPSRAQLKGRDCLCASHAPRCDPRKARSCHCSLFPQPHPHSCENSMSSDTQATPTLCVASATASPCSEALQEKQSLHSKTLLSTGHSITHNSGYTSGNNRNAQMLLSTSTLCRSTSI